MEIKPYEKNAKKHPKKQIEQVANSIKEFGMNQPIVVDKQGVIIVGHGRYEALKSLGMEIKDEYIKVVDLTEEQAMAYRLADNKLNESEWDMNLVLEELKGLSDEMVELTGFDSDLLIEPDDADDEVPDAPEEPQSKLGDLYELGEHRVLCGDSTKLEDVERLMDGKKADMVFTSPPYNGDTHLDYGNGENKKLYENNTDKWTSEEYISFCHEILSILVKKTNGFIFWDVMYNAKSRYEYIKVIYPFVDKLWETIVWKKTGMPISNGLTRNFEFIYVFKNGERKHLSKEFETESNFWDISNIGSQDKANHRACYPVALPQRGINIATEKNEIVLDPFLGSGSTLIASEKTGRISYGMELDPKYIDVIVQRYVDYTGNENIKLNGDDIVWKKTVKTTN